MPIYDFWCKNCDSDFIDVIRLLSEYDKPFECSNCGSVCEKKWSRVAMHPDSFHQGFYYPALGQNFTSKSEWQKAMKERNLAVVEPGMFNGMPTSNKERIEKRHAKRDIEEIKKEVAKVFEPKY